MVPWKIMARLDYSQVVILIAHGNSTALGCHVSCLTFGFNIVTISNDLNCLRVQNVGYCWLLKIGRADA